MIFRRKRSGKVLLDVTCAVAIVLLMVQMLIPAVYATREAARRLRCAANLRSIGLAMTIHQESKGYWPSGGWHFNWIGEPERGTGPRQPGSWVFNLLGYLGEDSLRSAGVSLTGRARHAALRRRCATPLELLHCPSRRPAHAYPYRENQRPFTSGGRLTTPLHRAAKTDYAANVGDGARVEFDWKWPGPQSLEEGDAAAFAWPERTEFTGIVFGRSQIRPRHVVDGLSKTYLVGEKYVEANKYQTGEDWGDNESLFAGFNNDNCRSTAGPPMADSAGGEFKTRFGSAHARIWQVVYCDGSVRAHDYATDRRIHRELGNRMNSRLRLERP